MFWRKIISGGLIFLTVLAAAPLSVSAAAVDSNTLSYLQNQDQSNVWVLMALRASGRSVSASRISVSSVDSATEIERTILGITAAGEDPSSFKGQNFIRKLDDTRTSNQIGSTGLLNDDMWGILAYKSAGISSSDKRITQSRDYLLRHQNSDGGWSHAPNGASDSNDTAMAISALIQAGVASSDSRIKNAVEYLRKTQNNDGGFGISPSSESDSASTAWIISALRDAGQAPASWVKNSKTPFMYLQTLKASDGSYRWKASETKGNPVMTSYVAVALAGKSYPVAVTKSSQSPAPLPDSDTNSDTFLSRQVQFRIEGSTGQVCEGSLTASTPLHLIEQAADLCSFSYQITNESFGKYLSRINTDTASGNSGWLYLVNWKQPSKAAADYQLQAGDYVTWYFGEFDWTPLRITLSNRSTAEKQGNPVFLVYEYRSGGWYAVSGATVFVGGQQKTTDGAGQAIFTLTNGSYTYYAQKDKAIRSARESFSVGLTGNVNTSHRVPLSAYIQPKPSVRPPVPEPSAPLVSFDLDLLGSTDSALGFGSLKAGESKSHTIRLRNTGTTGLTFTASVTGDSVFQEFIRLASETWRNFKRFVKAGQSTDVEVRLQIPNSYTGSGSSSGELIIWARP